jgi:hypothetical protein
VAALGMHPGREPGISSGDVTDSLMRPVCGAVPRYRVRSLFQGPGMKRKNSDKNKLQVKLCIFGI